MTDLTDKWKKGKLPDGEYYCKTENGVEILRTWRGIDDYLNFENMCNEVFISSMDDCEVLAPVPSYEEYLSLTYAKEEDERIIAEYEEENAQLKELLKECKGSIATLLSKRITEVNGIKQKELLTKINQALGEE